MPLATARPRCEVRSPFPVPTSSFFFFNDTATTEIYTLSLHDALPICTKRTTPRPSQPATAARPKCSTDRKSTRLNFSHQIISYAVFCLKKKKTYGRFAILTRNAEQCDGPNRRPLRSGDELRRWRHPARCRR